jgi:alkylhydroperoxidase family enzyme
MMAQVLNDIEWGPPLVPPVVVPEWETEAKKRFGGSSDFLRRVAPVPWLRRAVATWTQYPIKALPVRMADLAFLVVAQENSCRYCYGAARAHMRILGYSERAISQIEREMQLAELDPKDQAFIRFCRSLARSNPRPARGQRQELIQVGFSQQQVIEAAFLIVNNCFGNRVATFIALPPVIGYERIGRSPLGRLLRPLLARANRVSVPIPADFVPAEGEPFAPIIKPLVGHPAAYLLNETLRGAFDSPVLSRRVKALMFAVVARILECRFCEPESRKLLHQEGLDDMEVDASLSALALPKLDAREAAILAWVRDTVRYQPSQIQARTRALADAIGPEAALEAVGVAALANSTVRLAMLLE